MADINSSNDSEPHVSDIMLPRAPIKRARPQLSCTPCRQGKLKCDRANPVCDQCAKRSRHAECKYMPPPPKNKQAQNMRGRIRNLESLVVNLISQNQQTQTPHSTEEIAQSGDVTTNKDEPSVDSFGQLRISNAGTETNYVGAGHWSSLLKEIEEVKDSLEEDDAAEDIQEDEWNYFNARSSITFGVPRLLTKAMLISEMPAKSEVDGLLSLWFNSSDPLLFVIHAPTFQEEYKQFWRDPQSTPVMWIAMLYSIMALGIIVGPRNPGMYAHTTTYKSPQTLSDKNDHMARAVDLYQQMASSAMLLADMGKSQPYTLETLMVYGECEFLRRDDQHSKIWLMNGVALRIAMRMGYHRDPSNFKGITAFQGEMRRRMWHVLTMMDTLISFVIGLPAGTRRVESDVRPPRNLFDADISPNASELPKDRPPTEITPASYTIAKSRICVVFAEAAELTQKVFPPKHSYIMTLNRRLHEAHDQIPEVLRVRPVDDSITEPPVLIMSRLNIELLYLKTQIVLNRNYLTAGQSDPKYAESHKLCLGAALETLRYQSVIYHACQPGGQLSKIWWYMSSLNTYDFLLAAMILCLELNHLQTSDSSSTRIPELLATLQTTHELWVAFPKRFRESSQGTDVLETMLKKCTERQSNVQDKSPSRIELSTNIAPAEMTPESLPEDMPPSIWSGWPSAESQSLDIPVIPSEIDWTQWDNQMQGQVNMVPEQSWAAPQSALNTTDSWMNGTATSFDTGALDFSDPLNLGHVPTAYNPAPADLSWDF